MKNAIIDSILLGFILFASIILLIGTVTDQDIAVNKSFNLETLAKTATRALSKHYMYFEDMGEAEDVATNIVSETKIGKEVVNSNLINYTWTDESGNGEPDIVTTTIEGYTQDNFWFKFFKKNNFNLPRVQSSSYVTKEESDISFINVRYGGSNAGYYNMIGTYELDSDGCVKNPKLLLVNKEDYEVGDKLGDYENLDTRFFIIADGYNHFGNQTATENSTIEIEGCMGDEVTVTIDAVSNASPTYFQDTELNADDGYDHMHEVAKTYFEDYEEFISTPVEYCSQYRRGNCRTWSQRDATWEDWEAHALDNNIDYSTDPYDEYIITMEDLPNGGDKDFNDINLDTTKVRIPRRIDTADISGTEL